jgi:hypothetical protein
MTRMHDEETLERARRVLLACDGVSPMKPEEIEENRFCIAARWTLDDMARLTGLATSRLRRMAKAGHIPMPPREGPRSPFLFVPAQVIPWWEKHIGHKAG